MHVLAWARVKHQDWSHANTYFGGVGDLKHSPCHEFLRPWLKSQLSHAKYGQKVKRFFSVLLVRAQLSPVLLRVYLRPKSWQRKRVLFCTELKVWLKGMKGQINVRIGPSNPWPVPSLDVTGSKLTRFTMGLSALDSLLFYQTRKLSIFKLLFICKPSVVKPRCNQFMGPLSLT